MLSQHATLAWLIALASPSLAVVRRVFDETSGGGMFDIPAVVQAGEETIWHMNASGPSLNPSRHGRDEVRRILLGAWPEGYESYVSRNRGMSFYCVLVPCVARNVTKVSITIPEDAFPSDLLGAAAAWGDSSGWNYRKDEVSQFRLSGGTGSWSGYEDAVGWIDASQWVGQLPCAAVPCARACVEETFEIDRGGVKTVSRERRREFERCVEDCGLLRDDHSQDECITTNATAPASTTMAPEPSTASGSAPTTAPTPGSGSSEGVGGEGAASALAGGRAELLVGLVCAWLGRWTLA
ncbi:glycoside hydrolase family 81 protein [Paramyrothecium foliicola]|nr:glycoside hydrolase family 81 protein [Paramyrothecium foliicola]